MNHLDDTLMHYGILGMKWGVRRYQNYDGTLTRSGKRRYYSADYAEKHPDEGYRKTAKGMTKLLNDSEKTIANDKVELKVAIREQNKSAKLDAQRSAEEYERDISRLMNEITKNRDTINRVLKDASSMGLKVDSQDVTYLTKRGLDRIDKTLIYLNVLSIPVIPFEFAFTGRTMIEKGQKHRVYAEE